MATVTGMTAAAMIAIRDGTVVSAHFDSANHLILTKYDGTTIDAGALGGATTALAGAVELATSAETQTGTATNLAVTPAGLASLPGTRVQILSGTLPAESAAQSAYPTGISMMDVSGWSIAGGFGTVVTFNISQWRCEQMFYKATGGTSTQLIYSRHHNASDGGGGWTAWQQVVSNPTLVAASFTQLSAASLYPRGFSRLYYAGGAAGSWDFASIAPGEVFTYSDGSSFARQVFVQHVSGSSNKPVIWTRTSDWSTGWSGWAVQLSDPGAWTSYTPTWTSAGTGTPALGNAVVDCRSHKLGRKAEVRFEVTFGSTTTYGALGSGDNWLFSLPYPAARAGDSIGWLELHGSGNSNICMGRARTNNTTTFIIGVASGLVGATAPTNTGDVDSITPYTWASGMSLKGNLVYETAS